MGRQSPLDKNVLRARIFCLNEGEIGQKAVYVRRERDSEFGKMIPPHQGKKAQQKKKDKGRLSILTGWHKEGKGEPRDQRVFPSTSFSLTGPVKKDRSSDRTCS